MKQSHSLTNEFENIPEILIKAIRKHPDRLAFIDPNTQWTYLELGRLVQSARVTLEKLMHPGKTRIAIIGDNHPGYIVAYFGAQSAGIATVEIGRHTSLTALVDILQKTDSGLVITDRPELLEKTENVIAGRGFDEFLEECRENSGQSEVQLSNLSQSSTAEASIIYTSGTTGFPKGVVLTQRNFCFVVAAVTRYLQLTSNDRYALILPLCHTYGKIVMLTTFAAGAAILLPESFQNLPNFSKFLSTNKCTIFSAVPYHAHMLLKWGAPANYDFSALRAVTFSGNKLPVATVDRLTEIWPDVQIYSMYGLTESTTRACYVPPERLVEKKASCGRPLPGVELKIIGEEGAVLSAGTEGEVYIRGPNIMQGYFGDETRSNETLVSGWLKTGDIGYLDDEGFLYLVARKKDIIKCAGERISPMEIEETLLQHPGVSEAAVIGAPDPILGELVHAFIVAVDQSLKAGDLRTYCAKRLSHHKLPRAYTFVEEIPKTPTGKIKKHLLQKGD